MKSRVGKLEEEYVKNDKELNLVVTTHGGVNSGGIQVMASTYFETRLSYAFNVPKENDIDHVQTKIELKHTEANGIEDETKHDNTKTENSEEKTKEPAGVKINKAKRS